MRARHALNTATQDLRSVRVLRLRRIVPVPPPDRARRTAQPTCRHAVHARVAEARCGYRRGETCCEGRCSRGDVYDDRRASDARVRAYPVSRPAAPRWVIPLVILALLLALAGLGVDAYALHTQPAKVSGPTGAQGVQGPQGKQGKQGPAGTLASTSVVRGTPTVSAPNAAPGTVLDAQTSCPTGKILVSGGAQVSAPGVQPDRNERDHVGNGGPRHRVVGAGRLHDHDALCRLWRRGWVHGQLHDDVGALRRARADVLRRWRPTRPSPAG